jgi:bifunctional non-homologous end joining protein LigD
VQTKIEGAEYDKAKKLYDKVIGEKVGKGYKDMEAEGVSYSTTPVAVVPEPELKAPVPVRKIRWKEEVKVLLPQLLNPIDESELEKYLKDDSYGAQEKKDGKHIILKHTDEGTKAFNKKGKEVGYPLKWTEALMVSCTLDGEAIGEVFHVFDLLEVGGKDYRDKGYMDRYGKLIGVSFGDSIKLVPLAVGYEEKKALYDELMAKKKEGIVFKKLDAEYKPGRPNAYGDMVKFKFYAEASVRVCKGREGKHSIGMEVLDGSKWVAVGNCTVGPSIELPAIGSVVEIKYLYAYKGGSLYQPSFKEVRDDTDADECVIGQLKYKAEED